MTTLRALERAGDLGPGDHASWAYDDAAALQALCRDYFAEGRRRDERLVYVGSREHDSLVHDLREMPDRDQMIDDGQLSVLTAAELYGGEDLDPEAQVEAVRRCAEAAVAEGYAGLRILGDLTEIAADPDRARGLVVYESAVDRVPATTSMTALCTVDRTRSGPVWRELAALHPLQHARDWHPTFRLERDGHVLRLVGEVDAACASALHRLLGHLAAATEGELHLELHGLGFIDVAGTRVLARFHEALSAAGRALRFRGLTPAARRTFPAFHLTEDPDA